MADSLEPVLKIDMKWASNKCFIVSKNGDIETVELVVNPIGRHACDSVKCTSPPSAVTAPTEKRLMPIEGADIERH